MGAQVLLGKDEPTVENYTKAVQKRFGDKAQDVLAVYHAASDAEVTGSCYQIGKRPVYWL